tara:strand:+ start:117 stop:314 length:198 start_codon:yes stop_codon:yes gene_type:complete
MLVSNCCGARFYEPDYPDNDICTDCGEHAGAEDEDEYAEDIDLQAFAQGRKSSFDGINSQSDKSK